MSNCIKSKRKLIKGQNPLKHFIFYLDIENYIASKQIEEKIIDLGGRIAFFFAETVTHIVTDKTENKSKDNSNSLNSALITTPVECIKSNDSKIKSRADEMLQRVRIATAGQQQQEKNELLNKDITKNNLSISTVLSSTKLPVPSTSATVNNINKSHIKDSRIWDSKHAINILNKLINEREKYKLNSYEKQNILNLTKNSTNLKECYIKIESFDKFYRPYYKSFEKWPKINLKIKKKKLLFNYQDTTVITNNNSSINQLNNLNDNRLIDDNLNKKCVQRPTATITNCLNNSAIKILNNNTNNLIEIEKGQLLNNLKQNTNKTTTSGSDENNLKTKCGFCELCKIEYDNLNKHLISDSHIKFSENSQNYLELDTLINNNGLDLENFLKINNICEPNSSINYINNIDLKTTKESGTNNENNVILKESTIIKTNQNNIQLNEKQNISLNNLTRKKHSIERSGGSIANRTRKSIDKKNLELNVSELPLLLADSASYSKKEHCVTKNIAQNFKTTSEEIFIENHKESSNKYSNLDKSRSEQKNIEEQNNFLLSTATINHKRNSVKMTKCNGINKNLTKRLKADEITIDRHYFRETRQSMCKKNLYSITLPSAKATKPPIKSSRCTNSIKKSTITTRKSSPSKKSYYEGEDEEEEIEDDQDDDDNDVDFIDKNLTAPANVFHNNLRSQHKPNNCSRPKRNSMSMYYKVINSKNSLKKDSTSTIVHNAVDSKQSIKKNLVMDHKNNKIIEKPITIKIKKIRQTELSVLNGEAENFMFPKRLEQRKLSGESSSSEDDEPTKKKIKSCQTSKFNNTLSSNSNNFNNNSIQKTKSIIQFCSNEKILEKLNKTFLRGDIDKYRFAFEKVPKDELWYNVFRRQDTSKEHVFEYYGNTAYRKLPYEMGPLPALECKDKCLTCRLMENNLFKNESPNQIVLKDKIDIKKEILDKQHQEQQVDDEKVSNNSIENEINKSTKNDITAASKSNSKKLLKRDSSKSLLESYDIPRKSPREHASTLAILSCLLNSKNSSSGSENENSTTQNSNQVSTKLINSDESVILNYKRRPKKSLKLSKSLLENRINSTFSNSSNLDEQTYSPMVIEQKKLKTNLKSHDQTTNNLIKRPGRPMHWKQRPKTYLDQTTTNKGTKYENPVKLNIKIDKFLESSTVFADDDLDILTNTLPLSPILHNEIVSFSNDLNLIDLMDETLLKQQKIHFNKINTNVVKKRKNNNKTGWPKKKKILTRQQKRKSSQCENPITNCNEKLVFANTNIEPEFVSVDAMSTDGEDNVDDKISIHETDDDDTTTLKNEYLSAESNLDDNEINSMQSIEDDLTICCKYCGLSSKICDEQCNNVIVNIKNVRVSPIKQESPAKQSPIKISPRKLRKPRGRWYRER